MKKNLTEIHKLRREVVEMKVLYEISKTLGTSLDLNITLQNIMKILSEKMGMKRGTLYLLNKETGDIFIEVAHGLSEDEIKRGRYRIGEGITGKVVETGEPFIVPDVEKEPLFLNRTQARDIKRENISFICVPVLSQKETVGVISADRLFSDEISFEEDIRILTIIASLIGQAVKINQMVENEKRLLLDENKNLKLQLKSRYGFSNIIGKSKKMQDVFKLVETVARGKSTVLLLGESGTGKELVARAIHYNSPRSDKPFVKIDCAVLSENLLESELFGHEKGAFTDAIHSKTGKFELADGGTLFLDEIANMGLTAQAKLLHVIQDKTFEKVGGTKTITVDVRIIAATNIDLEQAIKNGKFREDLYYRLNVVPIFLSPLRDRKEDIPFLIDYFLKKFNNENQLSIKIDETVISMLKEQKWSGNVRELENFIERLVVTTQEECITLNNLPITHTFTEHIQRSVSMSDKQTEKLTDKISDIEKQLIMESLKKSNFVQSKAAKLLGISERMINYKIKKYNIEN